MIMDALEIRDFRNKIARRLAAAETAVKAADALSWLGNYGGYLARSGPDGANVRVHLTYASSTAYVEEGAAYLNVAAQEMLPEIVQRAREIAERHIAQGIEAGTAETAQPVPCEAREPDPEGDASNPDHIPAASMEATLPAPEAMDSVSQDGGNDGR